MHFGSYQERVEFRLVTMKLLLLLIIFLIKKYLQSNLSQAQKGNLNLAKISQIISKVTSFLLDMSD